jgi:hypothetical protein
MAKNQDMNITRWAILGMETGCMFGLVYGVFSKWTGFQEFQKVRRQEAKKRETEKLQQEAEKRQQKVESKEEEIKYNQEGSRTFASQDANVFVCQICEIAYTWENCLTCSAMDVLLLGYAGACLGTFAGCCARVSWPFGPIAFAAYLCAHWVSHSKPWLG